MNKITKNQFISGSFWKITETVAAKGVSFIVSLILARILSPDDYGIIAITTIFTNLSDVLIDGGFSTTLIRKKEVDELDYNCAFVASLSIAIVLYAVMFLFAPVIAEYYKEPILNSVLRVIGLVLFIQAFSSTRNAIIHRNMSFKLLFYCNVIGSVISGVIGIASALMGLGVWALVIQQLSQQLIVTILLFVKLHWKFECKFEWKRFKELFSFSIGVMGASLLSSIGSSLYNLVIGKIYSVKDLGYSDKGGQLPMQVSLYTFSAMSSVLLPTLSTYQDNMETFKRVQRKVVGMTAYMVFPLMIGLAVTSEDLIVVLLTDKWLPALWIMRFSCIYYIATPFYLVNIQVFYALGHGFKRIQFEVIRLVLLSIGFTVFSFGLKCNISQLAFINAIIACVISILTYMEVRKILLYKLNEAFADIYKSIIAAVVMGLFVIFANQIMDVIGFSSSLLRVIIDVICGTIVYGGLSWILRIDAFLEIINGLLPKRSKNE